MVHEAEIAWAAGFFEGKGSTYCPKGYNNRRLVLAQSSKQPDEVPPELLRFQAAVGGRGEIIKRAPTRRSKKQRWAWRLQRHRESEYVLSLLEPYFTQGGRFSTPRY